MSECVVRMEMPKNRCPVRFSIAATGYCPIEDRSGCGFDVTKERPDWCPIICQLPEGHGRLVDADAIPRFESGGVYTAYHFIEAIADTPTIVPATEGGSHEQMQIPER